MKSFIFLFFWGGGGGGRWATDATGELPISSRHLKGYEIEENKSKHDLDLYGKKYQLNANLNIFYPTFTATEQKSCPVP